MLEQFCDDFLAVGQIKVGDLALASAHEYDGKDGHCNVDSHS